MYHSELDTVNSSEDGKIDSYYSPLRILDPVTHYICIMSQNCPYI